MSQTISLRDAAIKELTGAPLDLLIIGGGIVGSGIARDAAMRGLRVGLAEQFDFAFGTSSRSSRLLHGGLRYLAQGKVGLVREASVEKMILSHIAPHLAQPLGFMFPCYRGTEWPLWQMRIGVKVYDLLCGLGNRNFESSGSMNAAKTAQWLPGINENKLSGAARYFDGLTNDARLVLDTLRSASNHGAHIANYLQFQSAERKNDVWECQMKDLVTGQTVLVPAKTVANATGPWSDRVQHSTIKLRLTKGIHMVIDKKKLPMPDAVVMTQGSRILFVIPWGERIVLGTTDTDYNGSRESVHAEPDEIEYVLKVTNELFPKADLTKNDVISTWAGLRPLIAAKDGSPSDISRAHDIVNPEPHWWDIAGGKLTTYRLIAEQTVDKILHEAGRTAERCRTAKEPLLLPDQVAGISGITPPPFAKSAVEHYCREEWARHLDDVMVRRTSWHYYFTDAAAKAEQTAQWMAEILGWTDAVRIEEVKRYQANTCSPKP